MNDRDVTVLILTLERIADALEEALKRLPEPPVYVRPIPEADGSWTLCATVAGKRIVGGNSEG